MAALLVTAAFSLLLAHRSGSTSSHALARHQLQEQQQQQSNVEFIHAIGSADCDRGPLAAGAAAGSTNSSSSSTSAAAAPPQQVAPSMSLLRHILPLTNFSSLTSAAVLDAAATAGTPVAQLQPLMQLHQQLWCG